MTSKKLFAIIVTYNPDLVILNKQLISLTEQVDEVIIVDNNSKNRHDLQSLVYKTFQAIFIFNDKNLGLGKAQNLGILEAKLRGASNVLLLDQDSVLDKNCVDNLVQERNKLIHDGIKIGAVGPLYYNEKTKIIYPISRYFGPFIKRFIPILKPA